MRYIDFAMAVNQEFARCSRKKILPPPYILVQKDLVKDLYKNKNFQDFFEWCEENNYDKELVLSGRRCYMIDEERLVFLRKKPTKKIMDWHNKEWNKLLKTPWR